MIGSPDNCGIICDEYQKQDKRVKVIHKKNGGLSEARNTAIDKCNGRYICFVDSDDYLEEDCIQYLYHLIKDKDCDISMCAPKLRREDEEEKVEKEKKEKVNIVLPQEALELMLYQKEINNSAWGIRYPIRKKYEDIGTTYKLIMKSKKIIYSNVQKYIYLQREGSIIESEFSKSEFDILEMLDQLEEDIIKIYPNLQKAISSRKLNAYFYLLKKMNVKDHKTYEKQYQFLKDKIRKNRWKVLFNYKTRIKTKAAIIISFFSFELTKRIQKRLKNLKMIRNIQ